MDSFISHVFPCSLCFFLYRSFQFFLLRENTEKLALNVGFLRSLNHQPVFFI